VIEKISGSDKPLPGINGWKQLFAENRLIMADSMSETAGEVSNPVGRTTLIHARTFLDLRAAAPL